MIPSALESFVLEDLHLIARAASSVPSPQPAPASCNKGRISDTWYMCPMNNDTVVTIVTMTILIRIHIFMTSPWSPTMSYLAQYIKLYPASFAWRSSAISSWNRCRSAWQCGHGDLWSMYIYTKCDASEKTGNWKSSLSKCLYVLILKALTNKLTTIIFRKHHISYSTLEFFTTININQPISTLLKIRQCFLHLHIPSHFLPPKNAETSQASALRRCCSARCWATLLASQASSSRLGKWRELESWFSQSCTDLKKKKHGILKQVSLHIYIIQVPGRAGGGSFRRKKNYIAKKEFAYRMCARWPSIAMSKLFFGVLNEAFAVSWLWCHVLWGDVFVIWLAFKWCGYLWGDLGTTPVLLCTTKNYNVLPQYYSNGLLRTTTYYSRTTLYYKVLLQYYNVLQSTTLYFKVFGQYYSVLLQYCSVLQSTTPVLLCTTPVLLCTTPVLLCTTKYYASTTKYYSVLQSTTPVLLCNTKYYASATKYYARTTQYYNVLLQYYSVLQSTTPVLQRATLYYKVLRQYYSVCTTKYYFGTTLYCKVLRQYYNVLLQYYSVLQSTTPVLLCLYYKVLRQYYNVLLQYYSVLQSTTPVLLCTTKYYASTTPVLQSTTLYYKVLRQYYSVLQSTTPVLLQYYKVLCQDYSVLPSTFLALLRYYIETSFTLRGATRGTIQLHQIVCLPRKMNLVIDRRDIWNNFLQCAEQQEAPSNFTKYCACHANCIASLIRITYETSFTMHGPSKVTLETHQELHLPQKINVINDLRHIWNVISNAWSK